MKKQEYLNEQFSQFIVYVRWDIILDWKGSEILASRLSRNEHLKPYAYGTAARGISKKIKPGDILWIMTLPVYGNYISFPSMVARLTVENVIDQEKDTNSKDLSQVPPYIRKHWDPETRKGWRYVIVGDKDCSNYFPVNNALDLVVRKILKGTSSSLEKRISGEHFGYIAQHFQTIRRIQEDIYNDFNEYSESIQKSPAVFISYRRKKSSGATKALAEALLKKGINCWLDVNRLPQHVSDAPRAKVYFEKEIENAIRESFAFISVISDDYFQCEWTKYEHQIGLLAENSGKLKVFETDRDDLENKSGLTNLVNEIISFSN